jgi:pimeloyl-ACP methyl ester carboxylesterase
MDDVSIDQQVLARRHVHADLDGEARVPVETIFGAHASVDATRWKPRRQPHAILDLMKLDRDGIGISYEVAGQPGGATPLLLTHGFSASTQMWQPNLPALARDRQVVVWDIRGHGLSDSPEEPDRYSEALSVADMAAVLDAAGVERAIVGGLSLGGYLSLAFHLAHPDRVAALMLFDTGPGYRRDEPRAEWNARVERTARGFEAAGLGALRDSPEVARTTNRNPAGLARAARGIMAQFDSRIIDSLPGIAVPTLVLVGADDAPFLAAAEYMAGRIPNATRVVVEGAGHASNLDRPEAFDRAVLDFLAACGA